jgi:molybdopterin synthase sulfur carrier subunit
VQVEVLLPGVLADDAGGARRVLLAVPDGARVTDVLDALDQVHPRAGRRIRDETGAVRRHVNLFVGEQDIRSGGGAAMPVPAGVALLVLPNVAGG